MKSKHQWLMNNRDALSDKDRVTWVIINVTVWLLMRCGAIFFAH